MRGFIEKPYVLSLCAPGSSIRTSGFPAGPFPTLLATYPPALILRVAAAEPGAAAGVMGTVYGRFNNASIVSVRPRQPALPQSSSLSEGGAATDTLQARSERVVSAL